MPQEPFSDRIAFLSYVSASLGKLFWGPMGKPHNRRYTLPTGSVNDTDWTQVSLFRMHLSDCGYLTHFLPQVVSWKGSIEKDQLIREIQKKRIERRVNKPPYPPMLHYKEVRRSCCVPLILCMVSSRPLMVVFSEVVVHASAEVTVHTVCTSHFRDLSICRMAVSHLRRTCM